MVSRDLDRVIHPKVEETSMKCKRHQIKVVIMGRWVSFNMLQYVICGNIRSFHLSAQQLNGQLLM